MSALASWVRSLLTRLDLEVRRRHDRATPPLAAVPKGMRRIHYGCGTLLFADWLNVDLKLPAETGNHAVLEVNLIRRHPFPDDSFELGFSEDFLEHVEQGDQLLFLAEAYRTLAPGGVLRLFFPSLERVLELHYQPCTYESALRARAECYDQHGHRSFPSRADIELMARRVGFAEVRFPEPGESTVPALKGLEHRTGQSGAHLAVELVKAPRA